MPSSKQSAKSEKAISYKIHQSRQTFLLAACDKELIGKTIKGKANEFFVNPRFYSEKETDFDGIKRLMRICSSANLVGERTVKAAIELGLADESRIIYFKNIPHAQYVIMSI